MLRKLISVFFVAVVIIAAVVITRTVPFVPQMQTQTCPVSFDFDEQAVAKHMSELSVMALRSVTDSKYYEQVSDDSYRFNPMQIGPEDLATFHGVNERISIDNLLKASSFYAALMVESEQ